MPGVYTLETATGPRPFAVNLDPAESTTTPLAAETLEQFGCKLVTPQSRQQRQSHARQMRDRELERNQSIWRILILNGNLRVIRGNRTGRAPCPASIPGDSVTMNASLELRRKLDAVGSRIRSVRLWRGLAVGWALFALVGVILLALPGLAPSWEASGILAGGALTFSGAWWLVSRRAGPDSRGIAQRIEAANPHLDALLLTAVTLQPPAGGRLGFLEESVVESALMQARIRSWNETIPTYTLNRARFAHFTALAAFVVVLAFLAGPSVINPGNAGDSNTAVALAAAGIAVQVEPGHVSLERGRPLLVTARYPASMPAEALLILEGTLNPPLPRAMTRSLDDPTFVGHVSAVDSDLSYRVEFPGGASETYRVTVFEHPELRRINAQLVFPQFTSMEPKTMEDVRHVTVVEGTEITLLCQLNKAVLKAVLIDEANAAMSLLLADDAKHIYRAEHQADEVPALPHRTDRCRRQNEQAAREPCGVRDEELAANGESDQTRSRFPRLPNRRTGTPGRRAG